MCRRFTGSPVVICLAGEQLQRCFFSSNASFHSLTCKVCSYGNSGLHNPLLLAYADSSPDLHRQAMRSTACPTSISYTAPEPYTPYLATPRTRSTTFALRRSPSAKISLPSTSPSHRAHHHLVSAWFAYRTQARPLHRPFSVVHVLPSCVLPLFATTGPQCWSLDQENFNILGRLFLCRDGC